MPMFFVSGISIFTPWYIYGKDRVLWRAAAPLPEIIIASVSDKCKHTQLCWLALYSVTNLNFIEHFYNNEF